MTRRPKDAIDETITIGNRKLFAERFRAARIAKGLSQSSVAIAIKHGPKSQSYISEIESGRQNLTIDTMSWLASIVGVDLADLLAEPTATTKKVARK